MNLAQQIEAMLRKMRRVCMEKHGPNPVFSLTVSLSHEDWYEYIGCPETRLVAKHLPVEGVVNYQPGCQVRRSGTEDSSVTFRLDRKDGELGELLRTRPLSEFMESQIC